MPDYSHALPGEKAGTVFPRFFLDKVESGFKSQQAGHPVYDDVEMVEIIVPGLRGTIACEKVKDHHRQRWPREYDAFKQGQELPPDGNPLKLWPPMTPATVANLAALNIHTVEALAALADGQLQNLGVGARQMRDQAQTWLEQAKGGEPIARLQAQIDGLTAQLAARDAQLADISSKMRAKEDA